MGDQEICVCYFVEILDQPQPKISRHLAYLRSAGIVAARREGKWMHYRIVMPPNIGAAQVLQQTLAWLREERAMQADQMCIRDSPMLGILATSMGRHRKFVNTGGTYHCFADWPKIYARLPSQAMLRPAKDVYKRQEKPHTGALGSFHGTS